MSELAPQQVSTTGPALDTTTAHTLSHPKLHIVKFDGTMAGSVSVSRGTVVHTIPSLIHQEENKAIHRYEGVGNTGGLFRWMWASATGSGTKKIVFNALRDLADNYHPGDRIVIFGYSRGAWKACYLAHVIDAIGGLPGSCGDADSLFHHLYKNSRKGKLISPEVAHGILRGHGCHLHTGVQIDALCLFDMVSSMGWSVLARRASEDVVSNMPISTRHVFHAVSSWESRVSYVTTLIRHGSSGRLRQVAFPGTHGNLGWMDRNNSNPLIMGPLAWMIDQLSSIGIRFDEDKLRQQFAPRRTWYNGPIFKPQPYERVIGLVTPKPGCIIDPDGAPPIQVHYSVRSRDFRNTPGDIVMPGYSTAQQEGGSWQWHLADDSRRNTNESNVESAANSLLQETPPVAGRRARILYEAPIGNLEDNLRRLMLQA